MYYNYHAKAKQLIKDGHLVRQEIVDDWNGIKPALVLYFDNHRPMPIRQYRWDEYFIATREVLKMNKHSIEYLSQYMTISEIVKDKINKHCKRYGINDEICAWYSDLEDFLSDWCKIGYTRTEARKIYHGGKGEFMTFSNGNIIRFTI